MLFNHLLVSLLQQVGFLKIVIKKKNDGSHQYQLNTDVNVMNNGSLKRVRVSTIYNTNENSEELANEMVRYAKKV